MTRLADGSRTKELESAAAEAAPQVQAAADYLNQEQRGDPWLTPIVVGTCDAGNCEELTVCLVWTELGWLSVCRHHALQALVPTNRA